MKWLVTGGAGFIGGHVVAALIERGIQPIILDDFSTGRRDFVPEGVQIFEGSLLDRTVVDKAVATQGLEGVIHIAGYKFAGESVFAPLHTYEQNVTGIMNLLSGMEHAGVRRIIFSSSAAVYGEVDVDVITEDHPTRPANPYGESKLIGEWMLQDMGLAKGFQHSSLRYFNVVGSRVEGIYDTSPYSLFSLVFGALKEGKTPKLFGSDYNTSDGTCVRDFIPVGDLADVHVVAAERLMAGAHLEPAYNIGTGTGHTVAEVMRVMAEETGIDFTPDYVDRRLGDPAVVVASGELARRDLEWNPNPDLRDMVRTAWQAFQLGYSA
jgi:UDP-glucose 4-epimerase